MLKLPCRVCLRPSNSSINMVSNPLPLYVEGNVSFLEMFAVCTEVAIEVGDNSNLCNNCQKRLIEAYKFRQDAHNAIGLLEKIKPETDASIKEEFTDEIYEEYEALDQIETLLKEEKEEIKTDTSTRKRAAWSNVSLPESTLNRFNCRYCFVRVEGGLKEHEMEHIVANGGLQCHFCMKKFRIRNHIREHIRNVHLTDKNDPNRIRYTCEICGRSYSEKSSLRNHKRDKHSDNPREIRKVLCPLCGKAVRSVAVHMHQAHENRTYTCDLCDKQWKCKEALKNHMRIVHLGMDRKMHECPKCGKAFRTSYYLKDHIQRVHYTTEQKYQCGICFTKFKSEQSMKFHMKMHNASLDHRCEICGAGFKTKPYLEAHKKVHSDVKEFTCHVCNKSFKRSGQLAKHVKIHENYKYFCELCPNDSFIDYTTLRMHKEKVHMGIRYKCGDCGKEYGLKKHLRQHQTAQGHDKSKWSKVGPVGEEIVDISYVMN
uniref:CSON007428 protein n=1 Tax=Culicoides sonorensis TaxID=179676 RepID=A0A336LGE0_CULSO